ncbi:MAG: TIGR02281 family clan AA aspartic protease [Candidatus Methylomirabilia bacterium]
MGPDRETERQSASKGAAAASRTGGQRRVQAIAKRFLCALRTPGEHDPAGEETAPRWRIRQLLLISLVVLAAGCASTRGGSASPPPKVSLHSPIQVPLQVVENTTLVSATLNGSQGALLMIDTGSDRTFITPALARRLGLSVPDDLPRRQVTSFGGRKVEVPFVRASVRVGAAMIDNLEVGVYEAFPDGPILDGLLGGDFLYRFRVTLDKAARQMYLEPLRAAEHAASPSPQIAQARLQTPTLSAKIKFGRFTTTYPPGGTVIKADLSNAPRAQREFDAERDAVVVFLYGVYHAFKPVNMEVSWFDPSGALVHKFSRADDAAVSNYLWHCYFSVMRTKLMEGKPGVWTVRLRVDGESVEEYSFRLIANHLSYHQ